MKSRGVKVLVAVSRYVPSLYLPTRNKKKPFIEPVYEQEHKISDFKLWECGGLNGSVWSYLGGRGRGIQSSL